MTPKLTGKSVMVTGGRFIGSHLADRIIQEAPANLVVVDNRSREENLDQARQSFLPLLIRRTFPITRR